MTTQPTQPAEPTTPAELTSPPVFLFAPVPERPGRFTVRLAAPGGTDGEHLGTVAETVAAEWSAEGPAAHGVAVPGFATRQAAAGYLYWYAPAAQSARSRPSGRLHPAAAGDRPADVSVCGCCTRNHCACEGTDRMSGRTGLPVTADLYPSLLPAPGVLFSLLTVSGGYLVDLNTRGAAHSIGYLHQQDDGTFQVRREQHEIGHANTPEDGMWALLASYTTSDRYAPLLRGFQPAAASTCASTPTAPAGPSGNGPRIQGYDVTWGLDGIEATDPRDAALAALAVLQTPDPDGFGRVFTVRCPDGTSVTVDPDCDRPPVPVQAAAANNGTAT